MARRLPTFLNPDETTRLLAAVTSPRDLALLLCGLLAGLRVSEIVHLRAEHLDFTVGRIFVFQGKGKKDRYCPMHGRLAESLRSLLAGREQGWVFSSSCGGQWHLTQRAVQNVARDAAARAGLAKRVSPHTLRHTFACRLLEAGATIIEVRDLLGHSSVATSQVYLHATVDHLRAAVDRL